MPATVMSGPPESSVGSSTAAQSPGAGSDVRVVGAAIVDDLASPRRLLAARRVAPPDLAGRWELPGGKVDPGEDDVSALHREVMEELGVRVELGAVVVGPEPGGRWRLSARHVMAVWWATVTTGEPAPLAEHDKLQWVGSHDLDDLDWLPGDAPIVRALTPCLVRARP